MSIRFFAIPQETADAFRAGAVDANGQPPEHHRTGDGNYPCRCCMQMMTKGDRLLILAYRPFSQPQPYAEIGPIFLHGDRCQSLVSDEVPPFLASPRYLMRGYDAQERIVYGSGRIVETPDMVQEAEDLFTNEAIRFIHVRSASNNCYHCRIERA